MKEKIFTGADRARELNFVSYRKLIEFLGGHLNHVPVWENIDAGHPIAAVIDSGRWLAPCECGEHYYAEPDDPLGYCPTCGNLLQGGKARPVLFPANRAAIEEALLERKLEGDPATIRSLGSQAPLFGKLVHPAVLPRHWDGQSVEELRAEHEKVREIMADMKKQRKAIR